MAVAATTAMAVAATTAMAVAATMAMAVAATMATEAALINCYAWMWTLSPVLSTLYWAGEPALEQPAALAQEFQRTVSHCPVVPYSLLALATRIHRLYERISRVAASYTVSSMAPAGHDSWNVLNSIYTQDHADAQ